MSVKEPRGVGRMGRKPWESSHLSPWSRGLQSVPHTSGGILKATSPSGLEGAAQAWLPQASARGSSVGRVQKLFLGFAEARRTCPPVSRRGWAPQSKGHHSRGKKQPRFGPEGSLGNQGEARPDHQGTELTWTDWGAVWHKNGRVQRHQEKEAVIFSFHFLLWDRNGPTLTWIQVVPWPSTLA